MGSHDKRKFSTDKVSKHLSSDSEKLISAVNDNGNKMSRRIIISVMSIVLLAMNPAIPVRAEADCAEHNNAILGYENIDNGLSLASGCRDVRVNGNETGWTAVLTKAQEYEPIAVRFATSQAESAVSVLRVNILPACSQSGTLSVSLWSPHINEDSRLKAYCYDKGVWKSLPLSMRAEHVDLDMTGRTGGVILITKCPSFRYVHNPAENEKVLKDAVVNPDAVYGFSPNPASTRLKDYVNALDWTDPDAVAEAKKSREEYHRKDAQLYRLIEQLLNEGKDVEAIARAVSKRRNEIRMESYVGDPDGLARLKKSNLDTYGNEDGPSADSLYVKYGSWQTVLEKALSSNAGMDACLGLYDEYYDIHELSK